MSELTEFSITEVIKCPVCGGKVNKFPNYVSPDYNKIQPGLFIFSIACEDDTFHRFSCIFNIGNGFISFTNDNKPNPLNHIDYIAAVDPPLIKVNKYSR